MKSGSWEQFKERYRKEGKSSEWTFERTREACERVSKDEIGRLGIVRGSGVLGVARQVPQASAELGARRASQEDAHALRREPEKGIPVIRADPGYTWNRSSENARDAVEAENEDGVPPEGVRLKIAISRG